MKRARAAASGNWPLPPRFTMFCLAFPATATLLAGLGARWGQALIGGFDIAALLFIVSLGGLTRDNTPAKMHADARANDSGRLGVLLITSAVMLAIVTAVAVELPDARGEHGSLRIASLVFVLASLVIAWLFSNLICALHYAHMYYREEGTGGLRFPGGGAQHCPEYWDFIYFALTIGMAFATSDVEIERGDIRRLATIHGVVAFFYNLIVLAFTINVTASS